MMNLPILASAYTDSLIFRNDSVITLQSRQEFINHLIIDSSRLANLAACDSNLKTADSLARASANVATKEESKWYEFYKEPLFYIGIVVGMIIR